MIISKKLFKRKLKTEFKKRFKKRCKERPKKKHKTRPNVMLRKNIETLSVANPLPPLNYKRES